MRFRSTQRAMKRGHLKVEFDSSVNANVLMRRTRNKKNKWIRYV